MWTTTLDINGTPTQITFDFVDAETMEETMGISTVGLTYIDEENEFDIFIADKVALQDSEPTADDNSFLWSINNLEAPFEFTLSKSTNN